MERKMRYEVCIAGIVVVAVCIFICVQPAQPQIQKGRAKVFPRVRSDNLLKRESMNMKAFYPFCPNSKNPYHWCSTYCVERYGQGLDVADLNGGWIEHEF